ncbi:NAD(P)/FAD-dependent oxidoreductase [Rhizohabitans arisaemae]|uniref:NAD(P)/FAD-dependent oxidoreductase n=1 Tax=Rhizohabitans arisaemae TaxID=2720610 RepID=UPI0024B23AB1|nr:FAD-dependent oxidoreductase [Rhizohabitans arisaemae]
MNGTAVVVGASVGGVRTAQALRREGWQGRITLVGAESHLPYDKPPLSKQLLAGTWDVPRTRLLDEDAAKRDDIELRLGRPAVGLDPADREVRLADGAALPYGVAVLATGSAARPSPWRPRSGLHLLRGLDDAAALRRDLRRPGPVVVVGGGFIGAEVAAGVRALGKAVTVVDPAPVPMGRVMGEEVGRLFTGLHHRHGTATAFGVGVAEVTGEAGSLEVRLTDGRVLPAATVVVGIGAVPNDAWLRDSGLPVEDGVLCDAACRVIGVEDVYAVGDVARWHHPGHGRRVRVEHWTNAVEQASCAAYNIVHPDTPRDHAPVEYVWSDQYDWKAQIIGRPDTASTHRLIGDPHAVPARFAALYGDDEGRLTGAVLVGWPKATLRIRRMAAQGTAFTTAVEEIGAME